MNVLEAPSSEQLVRLLRARLPAVRAGVAARARRLGGRAPACVRAISFTCWRERINGGTGQERARVPRHARRGRAARAGGARTRGLHHDSRGGDGRAPAGTRLGAKGDRPRASRSYSRRERAGGAHAGAAGGGGDALARPRRLRRPQRRRHRRPPVHALGAVSSPSRTSSTSRTTSTSRWQGSRRSGSISSLLRPAPRRSSSSGHGGTGRPGALSSSSATTTRAAGRSTRPAASPAAAGYAWPPTAPRACSGPWAAGRHIGCGRAR